MPTGYRDRDKRFSLFTRGTDPAKAGSDPSDGAQDGLVADAFGSVRSTFNPGIRGKGTKKEMLKLIKTMALSEILERADKSKDFLDLCEAPELKQFWEMNLKKLYGESFEVSLSAEINTFTQFKSYYYFNQALLNNELDSLHAMNSEELIHLVGNDFSQPSGVPSNLILALKSHSFQAIHEIAKRLLRIDTFKDVTARHIMEVVKYLKPLKTPGLMLTSKLFLALAIAHSYENSPIQELYPKTAGALDEAYIFILMAGKDYPYIDDTIKNATFGLGLNHIFPDFDSMQEASDYIEQQMVTLKTPDLPRHLASLKQIASQRYDRLIDMSKKDGDMSDFSEESEEEGADHSRSRGP